MKSAEKAVKPDNCPGCGVSLIGDPIPEKHLHLYNPYGWDTEKQGPYPHRHFRREIGIELRGLGDCVAYWQCPECKHAWHRYDKGHWLRKRLGEDLNAA